MRRQSALIGIIAALIFAACGMAGFFSAPENGLYDFFLRYRPARERSGLPVFLDVDNEAIAVNGVFPWPRSVMADGLLRLKEFGAAAVVFDIEYVDTSPRGLDTVNLAYLPSDFGKTFSDIDGSVSDLVRALEEGRILKDDALGQFSAYIDGERGVLLEKALGLARDNDEYLSKASALYGKSWVTLNLRTYPLEGEQASRRVLAEELFSYPVETSKTAANAGTNSFVDLLPPIPAFSKAARGAGFTRAYVDDDGVRRRIDLLQNVGGKWYVQLVMAPLLHYLGGPALIMEKDALVLRGARLPSGETKDIAIPVDARGRMLLDWPPASFENSYTHFSFAALSRLEQDAADVRRLASLMISSADLLAFCSRDEALSETPALLYRAEELFAAAGEERIRAVAETSGAAFDNYLAARNEAYQLLRRFRAVGFPAKIQALGEELAGLYPEQADVIREESRYLGTLAHNLVFSLDNFDTIYQNLAAALKDKFCVIGQTDAGTTDIGVTPFQNEYVNVGTHGVVLDTILSEAFLVWLPSWWSALFCLLTPLLIIASTRLAPGLRAVASFFAAALVLLASFCLFRFAGIFFNPVGLIFSLISAAAFREIAAYVVSDREKQFIHKAFSTYVSGDVVKELIADPSQLQLGGVERHMSALFTDIQGFSSIAEKLDPEDLVRLLNRYLTAASDIILNEKGTIDKYEGDAIIAFFGAPRAMPDHALRACLSAIAIKRGEAELNAALMEQKLAPAPLLTRIGINTGSMVAGNMGTENKMNYTIMGNTVNLAARLEGVNKQYGTWILASQAALDETGGRILARRLDRVRVVGITEPVRLYELLETREAATDAQKETAANFEKALALYEARGWKAAGEGFRHILERGPGDGPSRVFLKRCETFLEYPPAENWDGVINLDRK